MQNPKRLLLLGGGSGGHIIPNLAIASELRKPGLPLELLYIGSCQPLDRALVEKAGISFKSILSGKFRRYFSWWNFVDPFLIVLGFFQAFYHVVSFWPHVVFTKGGFVSLPAAIASWILRRPIILHESDSVMGMTNRVTTWFAQKVCLGFSYDLIQKFQIPNPKFKTNSKSQIPNSKFLFTGNPVRSYLQSGSAERGFELTGFKPGKPVLLVWGGSQGAQEINELVRAHFDELQSHFQIVHVTGQGKSTSIHHPHYKAFAYLEDELPHLYAITDFVFGRAGANSLAELALMQKPNLLLPLTSAASGHQQKNAEIFEKAGASLVLRNPDDLVPLLLALVHNEGQQKAMKEALARLAHPHAARTIAELILSNSKFQIPNFKQILNSNDLNSKLLFYFLFLVIGILVIRSLFVIWHLEFGI